PRRCKGFRFIQKAIRWDDCRCGPLHFRSEGVEVRVGFPRFRRRPYDPAAESMTSTSGRPALRPRLWVDFSMRDVLACFQGDDHFRSEDGLPIQPGASLLLNSGRASLHVLLESLSLPAGSKIGVPLFVCDAVFEAV